MKEYQFQKLQQLINTNPIVRELFAISNTIIITYDPVNYTLTFGTDKKKTCLCFKVENKKKR